MRPGYGGKHVVRCGVWLWYAVCGCGMWCVVVVCGVVCGMWYALGDINRAEKTADETGGTVVRGLLQMRKKYAAIDIQAQAQLRSH